MWCELWRVMSVNPRSWTDAGLMLFQRMRRWTNINPALCQRLVFTGMCHVNCHCLWMISSAWGHLRDLNLFHAALAWPIWPYLMPDCSNELPICAEGKRQTLNWGNPDPGGWEQPRVSGVRGTGSISSRRSIFSQQTSAPLMGWLMEWWSYKENNKSRHQHSPSIFITRSSIAVIVKGPYLVVHHSLNF